MFEECRKRTWSYGSAPKLEEIVSEREIGGWLEAIQTSNDATIDKDQLACTVCLIYDCGLGKDELAELKIGDIQLDENNSPEFVEVKNFKPIPIPPSSRALVQNYLSFRKQTSSLSDLLLPKYAKTKTLDRHLKNILGVLFSAIHKAGVTDCYARTQSVEATRKQYRLDPRSVTGILQDSIRQAGKPREKEDSYKRGLRILDKIPVVDKLGEAISLEGDLLLFLDKLDEKTKEAFLVSFQNDMSERLTFLAEREIERAEATVKALKEGAERMKRGEKLYQPGKSIWEHIIEGTDSPKLPKPSEPSDDSDDRIIKRLSELYYRKEDEEETPPDSPRDETPEEKS
jgi:hypothetical protein